MPIQGSLRDLSVLEALQLIGSQRKSVTLEISADDERALFHFREGRLIAARRTQRGRGEPFLAALAALGHVSPADALALGQQVHENGRDPWSVAIEVSHLERETCARVYQATVEAILDRVLLWERGHFAMLPPAAAPSVFDPGLGTDVLLLDAMRRLDELAAWKQGELPPECVPCLSGSAETVVSSDPVRRAALRQVDGHRTVAEIVGAARLGEYEIYQTLCEGIGEGWIEILDRPCRGDAPPPPVREILRRAPALAALFVLLILVATSSLIGKRISPDDAQWQEARARWEEIDLTRALDVYRYRTGAYPEGLETLEEAGLPLPPHALDRWLYQPDRDSFRLLRR